MLHDAAPQLGIRDGNHRKIADNFSPYLEQFIRFTNYQLPFYTVEGDTIYPHLIPRIRENHEVKAICLGNKNITRQLLLNHTGENDWVSYQSDVEQENLAQWVRDFQSDKALQLE